jgi:hypothetical protein
MKKLVIVAAFAAFGAQAAEVGVTAARDYSGDVRAAYGVTIGEKIGAVGITAGFERTTKYEAQNRYSLVAGYDVAKFGGVTITPKVGVAYLDNQASDNGYAMTVGVGASVPLAKKVSLGVDFSRQYGQDRVSQFDGNRVTTSVKYAF